MPDYPKEAFYDLLELVDGEEVIETNEAYYILEIKKTRAIKRKEIIICSDGINQDHLVIDLNRKEALLKKINFSLNLWQYPYTTARYHEVEFFSQGHMQLLEKHLKPYFDIGDHRLPRRLLMTLGIIKLLILIHRWFSGFIRKKKVFNMILQF